MYPKVKIDLEKIKHNTEVLTKLCQKYSISISGVTKAVSADKRITEAMISGGIRHLADSRIQNLKRMKDFDIKKMMLRLPMKSEISEVVLYADYSLNSEINTIKGLNSAAKKEGVIHGIILMIDVGDLREGIWFKNQNSIIDAVKTVLSAKNLSLVGIGTNLACFGGVLTSRENMKILKETAELIEDKFNINLSIISAGNSATIRFLDILPERVNNLRLGESILLGRETAFGETIENTNPDAFLLEAQLVELYNKPSIPVGRIGFNAFSEVPEFLDRGEIKKGLLAIGRQDINPESITPIDEDIVIMGASSDHLSIEVNNSKYKIGDTVKFSLNYEGILRTMTSDYIEKEYV